MRSMTPAQTALEIVIAIGNGMPGHSIHALHQAVSDARDEEVCVHRILARCRGIAHQHVIRCQVQADADAALGGTAHPRSEQALLDARELLASIEARLGVNND